MASFFKYWNECVDPLDMDAMWKDFFVRKEWDDAGEKKGQRVHLSRNLDGEPYLTQTEMKTVAEIVVRRHFQAQVDLDMLCAIAELQSNRELLKTQYNEKTKEIKFGIMQLSPETAEWLIRERNEEFIVRAYKGGPRKTKHKSTLDYWQRETNDASMPHTSSLALPFLEEKGDEWTYWDSRAFPEDMEQMWNNPDVLKEWTQSNEKRGKVRFSCDAENRPYLSRTEVKAVAEIILSKRFNTRKVRPTVLAALAELCSMRFVNGVGSCTGIMGIDYSKAQWLYKDMGYKAYNVQSVEDLFNPFASMYFGAAYVAWLSQYEGRERTPQFIVQAYLGGPGRVSLQETGPLWSKFQEALRHYHDSKKDKGTCSIL